MKRALLFLVPLTFARAEDLRIATQLAYSHPVVALETNGPMGTIQFSPRTAARPGVEIRYRNYGVSFSSPLAEAAEGPPRFLSGGLTDARAFYHGEAWGFEGYHRYARGFYAQSDFPGSQEFYHPGMTLRSTSATIYRAVGEDSRVYRLSEGLSAPGMEPDFMLTFGLSQNRLRDADTFLDGSGVYGSRFNDLRDLDLYSFSVGGGFALSTNAAGLYFDPALFAGFGMQYREWDGRPEVSWNLVKANLRMRLGYRNRWFDAGAGFENDAHAALAGSESAVFNSLTARAQVQVYL